MGGTFLHGADRVERQEVRPMRLIEIACIVKKETAAAYLITDDDETAHWVPKSQVEWHKDDGKVSGTMVMPEWLAIEKGLI